MPDLEVPQVASRAPELVNLVNIGG
jgi:hypothetical protein